MNKGFLGLIFALSVLPAGAAERRFDFGDLPLNRPPTNFVSIVAGEGKPGMWKVIEDNFPRALQPFSTNASAMVKKSVVAQVAEDMTDEHFPMLLLDTNTYSDFKLTTRFKIVSGLTEQMAGLAFRVQDEKNFYVVRASALGNNFRFYKVVNGQRTAPIGPDLPVTKGVWHELAVECKGNEIHCYFDGQQQIPDLHDSTFGAGRLGYWTKSDSVTYFTDTRVSYTPREPLVQGLVRETMATYSRLLGLQIVMLTGKPPEPRVVASTQEQEIGQPGRPSAVDVINTGRVYWDKQTNSVTVTMPLRDRNGDGLAAVRVIMKTFPGQTEENALTRARPVVDYMQKHVPASNDWNE